MILAAFGIRFAIPLPELSRRTAHMHSILLPNPFISRDSSSWQRRLCPLGILLLSVISVPLLTTYTLSRCCLAATNAHIQRIVSLALPLSGMFVASHFALQSLPQTFSIPCQRGSMFSARGLSTSYVESSSFLSWRRRCSLLQSTTMDRYARH